MTDLPRLDRCTLAGLPVLRPVRKVADLLRLLPPVQAVVVGDAAQHAALCTRQELEDELLRHRSLRGVRAAREAVGRSDGRAESPPETYVRLLLVDAGLAPVPQHDVHDARGRWVARVDLAFPAARVAIEYDGRLVHLERHAFGRDRRRQNDLVAQGWLVLRHTADDLARRPYVTVQEVRAALLRAT